MKPGNKLASLFTSSSANFAAGMHACPPCQPPFPAIGKIPPMCNSFAWIVNKNNVRNPIINSEDNLKRYKIYI